ncbi:MAG: hypothetical protein K2H13_07450 [Eubacterium sp.]|nr:hypothetical protein [Eubacterium sp.]MDE6156081.1 hypothetical protein [Eubacterium sp.]
MAIKLSDIFGSADLNINNQKLEEMFNKTKDMAETVSKKSAERLEMSRKMIECLDAKTKLSKLYEKYGEMQYNSFVGEKIDSVELEGIANRIADLKEKIDELNVEIDEAKVEFSEAVVNATKKTRDVFQKEFDKMNKAEVIIPTDEVEVTEAKTE